jgi:hypothetical protein
VPQPGSDRVDVNTGSEQVNGRRMSDNVRAHLLSLERRTKSCTAIIQTNDLPSNIDSIKRGEFGIVQKEWTLKGVRHAAEIRDGKLVQTELPADANLHFVISTVTLQLLETYVMIQESIQWHQTRL